MTEQEERALREGAAVVDLAHRRCMRVSGADRVRFLNGQVTNDVNQVTTGRGALAAHLTPKGKIIATFRMLGRDDDIVLDLEQGDDQRVVGQLRRITFRDKVTFEPMSTHMFGLYGPRAAGIIEEMLLVKVDDLPGYDWRWGRLHDATVMVMADPDLGVAGYRVAPSPEHGQSLLGVLLQAGAGLVSAEARDALRVAAGTPADGRELTDEFFPAEANLLGAVNFNKGCYVGQEFVARLKSRGHVNRRLVRLEIDGSTAPKVGEPLVLEDKDVGRLTSVAWLPVEQRVVGLGYARVAAADGARVTIGGGGVATVRELAEAG